LLSTMHNDNRSNGSTICNNIYKRYKLSTRIIQSIIFDRVD